MVLFHVIHYISNRGLISIEILKIIEELCNEKIHKLFDVICGVSTGAILAMLIGIQRLPLEECEQIYKRLSVEIFERNSLLGTGKLFWNHAFYDTAKLEDILKLVFFTIVYSHFVDVSTISQDFHLHVSLGKGMFIMVLACCNKLDKKLKSNALLESPRLGF